MEQDAAFGIRQIVDIALKALSPGINDTTTAVMCVDHLTAILARFAPRPIPSSFRYEEGELKVMTIRPTFASLLTESFDRHHFADARRFPNSFQFDEQPKPPAGPPRTSTIDRRTGRAHRRVRP